MLYKWNSTVWNLLELVFTQHNYLEIHPVFTWINNLLLSRYSILIHGIDMSLFNLPLIEGYQGCYQFYTFINLLCTFLNIIFISLGTQLLPWTINACLNFKLYAVKSINKNKHSELYLMNLFLFFNKQNIPSYWYMN